MDVDSSPNKSQECAGTLLEHRSFQEVQLNASICCRNVPPLQKLCKTSCFCAGGDGTGAAGGNGGNGGDAATSVGRKLQGAPLKKPAPTPTPTITTTGGNGGNGGGAVNKGPVTGGNGGDGEQACCFAVTSVLLSVIIKIYIRAWPMQYALCIFS